MITNIEFTLMDCDCGGHYYLTKDFCDKAKINKGISWSCPYCKTERVFTETENEKLQKEIDNLKSSLSYKSNRVDNLVKEREYLARSKANLKGQITKLKKKREINANRQFKKMENI